MFYIQYVLKINERENFFQQYGQFIHSIMEKYGNGELELFELIDYYKDNYNSNIIESPPYNKYKDLAVDYYEKGLEFLEQFDGFDDKTIAVEKEVEFDLELQDMTIKIKGFVDRIQDDNGILKITDYKSKKQFKDEEEKNHYAYQLYLYQIPVSKMFGKQVGVLDFNMFRQKNHVKIDFQEDEKNKTIKWVDKTIHQIYADSEYNPQKDCEKDFFCQNLCSCYEYCFINR